MEAAGLGVIHDLGLPFHRTVRVSRFSYSHSASQCHVPPGADWNRNGPHRNLDLLFALGEALGRAPEPERDSDLFVAGKDSRLGRVLLRVGAVRGRHRWSGARCGVNQRSHRSSIRQLCGDDARAARRVGGLQRGVSDLVPDDHGGAHVFEFEETLTVDAVDRGRAGGHLHFPGSAALGHEHESGAHAGIGGQCRRVWTRSGSTSQRLWRACFWRLVCIFYDAVRTACSAPNCTTTTTNAASSDAITELCN